MLSELQIAEFAARCSGRDKKILEMKMEGHTAQEIAEAVGLSLIHILREFLDASTLAERLKNREEVSTEYRAITGVWYQARFIVKLRNEAGAVSYTHLDCSMYWQDVRLHWKEAIWKHRD